MNKKDNEEFKNHTKRMILENLNTLNTDPKLKEIKDCCSNNFNSIVKLIKTSNSHIAIEDITNLCNLKYNKMDSFVMKQINDGIVQGIISETDIS